MNADARREALAALVEISDMVPEVRIGQLVAHLGFLSEDNGGRSLADIDDGDLLAVIRRHRQEVAGLFTPNTSVSPHLRPFQNRS